jgi:hypothetical protein
VVGTPYTGDCEGCDFAMSVTQTVTADASTADCDANPVYSLQGAPPYTTDLFVAGSATYDVLTYTYGYGYSYATVDNAFRIGYFSDFSSYGGGVYGPSTDLVAYDGHPEGTFVQSGTNIVWDFSTSSASVDLGEYYYACTYGYTTEAYGPAGGETSTGSLDCDGYIVDTWTFEGVAGGTATVTVDTVDAGTAFDPVVWVNDASGCTVARADDSFDCTFPPPRYSCPGLVIEDLAAETYEVVVKSYGSCAGTSANYELSVDVTP